MMGYQHSWFNNEKSGLSGFYKRKKLSFNSDPLLLVYIRWYQVLMFVDITRSQANPYYGAVEYKMNIVMLTLKYNALNAPQT